MASSPAAGRRSAAAAGAGRCVAPERPGDDRARAAHAALHADRAVTAVAHARPALDAEVPVSQARPLRLGHEHAVGAYLPAPPAPRALLGEALQRDDVREGPHGALQESIFEAARPATG